MSLSFDAAKKSFHAHPTINPDTNRKIKNGSDTYERLVAKYGEPKKRSVRRKSASPVRRSPVRRSPSPARRAPAVPRQRSVSPRLSRASHRSPMLSHVSNRDPFEVLSDEAIHKVLLKLSKEHARAWINASPKVRRVAEAHHMMF